MCQFLKKCDYLALSSKPNIYIPAQMVSMFCASDSKSATTLLNTPLVLHNIALRIENLHKCLINSVTCLKWDRKTTSQIIWQLLSIVVENRQIILWSAISCWTLLWYGQWILWKCTWKDKNYFWKTIIIRESCFFILSWVWDKEKILSPHEELNLRPSDSTLWCPNHSVTETPWWARSIMKFIWHMSCILLQSAMSIA